MTVAEVSAPSAADGTVLVPEPPAAVVELSASYDGGPTMYGVSLLDFRRDKIARERIYVMEGWEAPEWRAPWRSSTPADPPALMGG